MLKFTDATLLSFSGVPLTLGSEIPPSPQLPTESGLIFLGNLEQSIRPGLLGAQLERSRQR